MSPADEQVLPDFDTHSLVPAVTQDHETGEVLMLAYVDREAWGATVRTGYAHYHSRSRDKLWKKGESSGHVQQIVEIRIDCDADTILYRVRQTGPACHTGNRSCFYRTAVSDGPPVDQPPEAGSPPSGSGS